METSKALIDQKLFWVILDYLYEPAVADAMMSILLCEFPKQADHVAFYKALVDAKLFDEIGNRIYAGK